MEPMVFIHECLRRMMEEDGGSPNNPSYLASASYALGRFTPLSWDQFLGHHSTENMISDMMAHMVNEFSNAITAAD